MTNFALFDDLKIRREMAEISESIFRRIIYDPNACFRFSVCQNWGAFQKRLRSKIEGKYIKNFDPL